MPGSADRQRPVSHLDWYDAVGELARRSGSAVKGPDAMRVTYRSADYVNCFGTSGFRFLRTLPGN